MKNFIVIEGDNGSGKTTLAQSLKSAGFFFVSEDATLEEMKVSAKNFYGLERTQKFYDYNMHTAEKALQVENSTPLVVRYWGSTLADAFAEKLIGLKELRRQCSENVEKFPSPAAFFYLKCNYAERMKRIDIRRETLGITDDSRSKSRSERYRRAVMEISFAVPVPWIFIPADASDSSEVREIFLRIVNKIGG